MAGEEMICRGDAKDELSTASAQRRLQSETRSFSNAMAKAALHKATARFEADRQAAQFPKPLKAEQTNKTGQ